MRWVTPSEKDTANEMLEKRRWDAARSIRGANDAAIPWSDPASLLVSLAHALG